MDNEFAWSLLYSYNIFSNTPSVSAGLVLWSNSFSSTEVILVKHDVLRLFINRMMFCIGTIIIIGISKVQFHATQPFGIASFGKRKCFGVG